MFDDAILLISIVAIIVSVIAWITAYSISKKQLLQPTLEYLRRDYRSPEMMLALMNIWSFNRICKLKAKKSKKDLNVVISEQYIKIANEQEKEIDNESDYNKKLSLINNSISYQRRLVITFYYYLYEVWFYEILKDEMIFHYWDYDTLGVFDILKPMEKAQSSIFASRDDKTKDYLEAIDEILGRLDILRNEAKKFRDRKN